MYERDPKLVKKESDCGGFEAISRCEKKMEKELLNFVQRTNIYTDEFQWIIIINIRAHISNARARRCECDFTCTKTE